MLKTKSKQDYVWLSVNICFLLTLFVHDVKSEQEIVLSSDSPTSAVDIFSSPRVILSPLSDSVIIVLYSQAVSLDRHIQLAQFWTKRNNLLYCSQPKSISFVLWSKGQRMRKWINHFKLFKCPHSFKYRMRWSRSSTSFCKYFYFFIGSNGLYLKVVRQEKEIGKKCGKDHQAETQACNDQVKD